MQDSKEANVESGTASPPEEVLGDITRTHDTALDFLKARPNAANPTLYLDQAYTRRLRRKVDFIVMPFLMLCYVFTFIDKVMLHVRDDRPSDGVERVADMLPSMLKSWASPLRSSFAATTSRTHLLPFILPCS